MQCHHGMRSLQVAKWLQTQVKPFLLKPFFPQKDKLLEGMFSTIRSGHVISCFFDLVHKMIGSGVNDYQKFS